MDSELRNLLQIFLVGVAVSDHRSEMGEPQGGNAFNVGVNDQIVTAVENPLCRAFGLKGRKAFRQKHFTE